MVAKALAFDKATFGWDRWNFNASPVGAGGTVIAIAHAGTNLNNAYFSQMTSNGQKFGVMQFGDGDGQLFTPLARCLDVAGHELGHGVVSGTADLVYHNQSGALNEHFADVFGWLLQPADTGIGERCMGSQLPRQGAARHVRPRQHRQGGLGPAGHHGRSTGTWPTPPTPTTAASTSTAASPTTPPASTRTARASPTSARSGSGPSRCTSGRPPTSRPWSRRP